MRYAEKRKNHTQNAYDLSPLIVDVSITLYMFLTLPKRHWSAAVHCDIN